MFNVGGGVRFFNIIITSVSCDVKISKTLLPNTKSIDSNSKKQFVVGIS